MTPKTPSGNPVIRKTGNPITSALNLKAAGIFRLLVVTTTLLGGVLALGGASIATLQGLYSGWQLARAHSLTVYLPPEADATALTQLAQSLPTLQGVTSVTPVNQQEVQSWLGPAVANNNLPLPTVVEVAFTDGTDPAPLIAHIKQSFSTAEVDDHQPLLQQVSGAVRGLQTALFGLGAAMLALMALLITLTTRTGLQAQSSTLHLLVQLGSTDGVLIRSVCTQVFGRTFAGYTLGTTCAAILLMVAGNLMPGLAAHTTPWVWVALFTSPLLLPVLALLTAAVTTRRLLRKLT